MSSGVEDWVNYFPDVATVKDAECVLMDANTAPGWYLVWCVSDTPRNRLYRVTYAASQGRGGDFVTRHIDVAYHDDKQRYYIKTNPSAGLFPTLLHLVWTRKYLDLRSRLPGAVSVMDPVKWSGVAPHAGRKPSPSQPPVAGTTLPPARGGGGGSRSGLRAQVEPGLHPDEVAAAVAAANAWAPPKTCVGKAVGRLSAPYVQLWSRVPPRALLGFACTLVVLQVVASGVAFHRAYYARGDVYAVQGEATDALGVVSRLLQDDLAAGCADSGAGFTAALTAAHVSLQQLFDASAVPAALVWTAATYVGGVAVLAALMWMGAPTVHSRGYLTNEAFADSLMGVSSEHSQVSPREAPVLRRMLRLYLVAVALSVVCCLGSLASAWVLLGAPEGVSLALEAETHDWVVTASLANVDGSVPACAGAAQAARRRYYPSPAILSMPVWRADTCQLAPAGHLHDLATPDDTPWFMCNDLVLPTGVGFVRIVMLLAAALIVVMVVVPSVRATLEDFVPPRPKVQLLAADTPAAPTRAQRRVKKSQ